MKPIQILGGMSWESMAVYVTAAVARGAAALAAGRDHVTPLAEIPHGRR